MEKKRLVHIDIIKMVGIFFVILGHVTLVANIWPEARNYSYAFHMPLFFFAYGMSQKIKNNYSIATYKSLLVSRFYGLIVPYLLWGLIYTAFSAKNLGLLLYGTRHSIMQAGSLSSLWFLPTMFVACIYFEIVCHIVSIKPRYKNIIMLITIAVSLMMCLFIPSPTSLEDASILGLPLGLDIAFMSLIFMILGHYTEDLVIKFQQSTLAYKNLWLAVISVISFFLVYFQVWNKTENGFALMAQGSYGNYGIFFFIAIAGCIGTVAVSLLLEQCRYSKEMAVIGANTLVIFVTHKAMIDPIIMKGIDIFKNEIVSSIAVSLLIFLLSTLLALFINHVVPILAGKRR